MQKLLAFIFFTWFATTVSAQVDGVLFDTLTGNVSAIKIKGNDLYVAESSFFTGNIRKYDLTQDPPQSSIVVPGVIAGSMDIVGHQAYWLENAIQLSTADLSQPNPVPSTYYEWPIGNLYISHIASDGNRIFALEWHVDSSGMTQKSVISSISISTAPVRTVFYETTDQIANFDYANDALYILNQTTQKIQKISTINGPNPVATEVNSETNFYSGLEVVGNRLFASSADVIYTFDLTMPDQASTPLTNELPIWPVEIEQHNGKDLYFSENQISNKIYKASLAGVVSTATNTVRPDDEISLSPNPVENFLFAQGGMPDTRYRVFNATGVLQLDGKLSDANPIDVHALESGLYFFQFETGKTLKFFKW